MTSALGSIQAPQGAPKTEPGVCQICGSIAEVPEGVVTFCYLHEERAPMLTVRFLFQVLGHSDKGTGNPRVGRLYELMAALQAHILPEEQEETPDPAAH